MALRNLLCSLQMPTERCELNIQDPNIAAAFLCMSLCCRVRDHILTAYIFLLHSHKPKHTRCRQILTYTNVLVLGIATATFSY